MGWTKEELKMNVIRIPFGPFGRENAWVDKTGLITLPSRVMDFKDLNEIVRKAQSWFSERALANAPRKSWKGTKCQCEGANSATHP